MVKGGLYLHILAVYEINPKKIADGKWTEMKS